MWLATNKCLHSESFNKSIFTDCCFTGWETEGAFYKAMIKGGRNNMALLTVLGLFAVPSIAAGVAIIQRYAACCIVCIKGCIEMFGANLNK